MKVAIFTDNDFAKVNGVTTTLRAVLEHAPDDLNLRVYTCDGDGIDLDDYLGLPAFGVPIPFSRDLKMYVPPLRRFLRHAVADGVDLVHVTTPGPVGLAAIWVASRLGLRMIGSVHTDLAVHARLTNGSRSLGNLMRQYMRWQYGSCERVFATSEATRDMLIRAKINPTRIDIWRRGVSTTRFDPAKRSAALREQWKVSSTRPALLYVGRLSREKGLGMLEPLSRFLRYAGVTHRLVLIGDSPLRSELAAVCPEAVFSGTLSPDHLATAMASADLFVFPSRTDTSANVVLEAQASGLPVLVSRVAGPCENLLPGESGFSCDGLVDFARRAANLIRQAGTRQRFSDAARRYALTRDWDTALEPLYRAYASPPAPQAAPSSDAQAAAAPMTTAVWEKA